MFKTLCMTCSWNTKVGNTIKLTRPTIRLTFTFKDITYFLCLMKMMQKVRNNLAGCIFIPAMLIITCKRFTYLHFGMWCSVCIMVGNAYIIASFVVVAIYQAKADKKLWRNTFVECNVKD